MDLPTAELDQPADQRRGATVDYVVSQIRSGILDGRYVAGQRLITRDLTEDLGISRGPIREALRRLAAEGMVELVPNRSPVVRHLTIKQVSNLFQIRETLEGLAARLARRTSTSATTGGASAKSGKSSGQGAVTSRGAPSSSTTGSITTPSSRSAATSSSWN